MSRRQYAAIRRNELRATYDLIEVTEDTPLTDIDVLANDKGTNLVITRIDGKPIEDGGDAVAVDNGEVTLVDGLLTFTPDLDYTGVIAFTYTVEDGRQAREGIVKGEVV